MAPDRIRRSMSPMAYIGSRKKIGLAAALVVALGIMWVRVLIGHKPQTAAAHESPAASSPAASGKTPVKVHYVNLPVIAGRNDTIEWDFFAGRDWSGFSRNAGSRTSTDTEVARPNTDRTQDIERVARKLNVQVVILRGDRPEAFIDDASVHVGDTISAQEGTEQYVFEVKQIVDDSVRVECGGKSVTLKMK
jgi:hypothetical protein